MQSGILVTNVDQLSLEDPILQGSQHLQFEKCFCFHHKDKH
jgi:hypothetical protein